MRKNVIPPSSLRRNILANYVSQFYVTIVGIVAVPLYLQYLGVEAYGLVGFFAMVQAWFNLLDCGLTPTMVRETGRFHGSATDALSYRRLVRMLQTIFIVTALVGGGILFAAASFIAQNWLKAQELPVNQVEFSVRIMAIVAALRWQAGLYRGAISGSERLVWLGGYNATIATFRFVGVVPVLMYLGGTPKVFFTYQLLVAVIELAGLAIKTYGLLPAVEAGERVGWSFAPIRPVLKFSLTIAFTSSVWVLVTQTDKLLLSKLLPLADYGYFTLAVLVASGVMITTGPISTALIPRLARLEAQGDQTGLIRLYRDASQFMCVIALPVAFTLAAFAENVVWAWTGDWRTAKAAAPILELYALGNGVLAIAAFPYYLQFAKGDLRLHLVGNAIFVLLLVPSLLWATWKYGGVGAGWAWLGSNTLYFFGYTPLVHRRLTPGLHWEWLKNDVFRIAVVAMAVSCLMRAVSKDSSSRVEAMIISLFSGIFVLLAATLASTSARQRILNAIMPRPVS